MDSCSTHHLEGILEEYDKLLASNKFPITVFRDTFDNADKCLWLYFHLKYAGKSCKKCGRAITENYSRSKRILPNGTQQKCFRCRSCHTVIYPLSNSLFARSPMDLREIFYVLYYLTSTNSCSALLLTRHVSISYKKLHRLMMNFRNILGAYYDEKMTGVIEVDEAFIGKGSRVYNWSGVCTQKQIIIGMVERGTKKVRLFLVKDRKASTIISLIRANVAEGSVIYTDSWRGYNALSEFYKHETVDHSKREYVRGEVHTNTIENIWGVLKKNLRRAHIKITEKYIQQYINEAAFKQNNRDKTHAQKFDAVLRMTFFSDTWQVS